MKKGTASLASQVTEESTIKPVALDHVNLNDFIFDGNETDLHFSSIAAAFGQN